MPCCKAERYEWCKVLPIVYTDEENKGYCVFHAPQGKKKISLEKFNKLIFEEINQAKKSDTQCTLNGTVFEGSISFRQFDKDNPLPEISFEKATFSEEVNFSLATFSKIAYFLGTTFSKEVNFKWATFNEEAYFREVTFNGKAYFAGVIFSKETNFSNATFNEEANFLGVTFSAEINFGSATFNENAFFFGATFSGRAEFWDVTFRGKTDFTKITIAEKIRFEGVNLSALTFIDTDLTKIDFINCKWPKSHGRNILYDEICLFSSEDEGTKEDKKIGNILNRFQQWLKQWVAPDKERIKKVEILYRQLKRKCKEEHNELDISDWHYGEKEMYRKGTRFRRFFPISLSNLYWLSSGYGERPARAGIVLVLLILVISVLFGFVGLDPNSELEVNHINGINDLVKNPFEVLANTLQYATFEKDTYFMPQNIWGTFLKIFAKLFIPLQAALFAFSVRNRFRR